MNPQFPKMGTAVPKLSGQGGCYCGRRGLPREWVMQMYADYLRLGSLEKAGALHGRTRQNMFGIFQTHGLKLNAKKFLPVLEYKGRKYTEQKTCGRHRYLRDTVRGRNGDRTIYLHHVIWMEHHGAIPKGHKVVFRDGNHRNCAIENLELLTNSEQVKRHATGANGATKLAKQRLAMMLQGGGSQLANLRRAA